MTSLRPTRSRMGWASRRETAGAAGTVVVATACLHRPQLPLFGEISAYCPAHLGRVPWIFAVASGGPGGIGSQGGAGAHSGSTGDGDNAASPPTSPSPFMGAAQRARGLRDAPLWAALAPPGQRLAGGRSSEDFRSGLASTTRQVIVRWPCAQDPASGYRYWRVIVLVIFDLMRFRAIRLWQPLSASFLSAAVPGYLLPVTGNCTNTWALCGLLHEDTVTEVMPRTAWLDGGFSKHSP